MCVHTHMPTHAHKPTPLRILHNAVHFSFTVSNNENKIAKLSQEPTVVHSLRRLQLLLASGEERYPSNSHTQ